MTQFQIQEIIRKVGNGESINGRQRFLLANAPSGAIDESIAELIGLNGGDMHLAADLAIKIADAKVALLSQVTAIAAGGRLPDADDRSGLLARVRQARGNPPEELNIAFDLAPTAGWSLVAEALERRFAAKPKRAA